MPDSVKGFEGPAGPSFYAEVAWAATGLRNREIYVFVTG